MRISTRPLRALIGLGLLALVACGPATLPPGDQTNDIYEERNRAAHQLNLAVDEAVLRPVSQAYGQVVPEPIRRGVSNFSSNLNQPGYVVNDILQLNLRDALRNTARFAVNTTIGLGGLIDVASEIGLDAEETDFGETLHVYGVGEGNYGEAPFLGPTTTRDFVGRAVDFALNPLRGIVDAPESYYLTGADIANGLNARYTFAETIDSVFYESSDSYAQTRSLYLQQRRFELGGSDPSAGFGYEDPYSDDPVAAADPTTDPYYDPYSDPYFDPYAQ